MSQIINSEGLVLYDGPLHGLQYGDLVIDATLPADDTRRAALAETGHQCLHGLPQDEKVPKSWECADCGVVWRLRPR